jgi:hypothetical protein
MGEEAAVSRYRLPGAGTGIGVGLPRLLFTAAARLAFYRSYRDELSP